MARPSVAYRRQNQYKITVVPLGYDGPQLFGAVWNEATGLGSSGDNEPFYPGNALPPVNLGGQAEPKAITITKGHEPAVDRWLALEKLVNELELAITIEWDGGESETRTGVLIDVSPPEPNAGSNSAATGSIQVAVDA